MLIGMEETRRQFATKVKELGGVRDVAARLGCSTAFIHFLISGKGGKRPSLDTARAIEQLMGIPMQAWANAPAAPSDSSAPPDEEPRVELDPVEGPEPEAA